MAERLKRAAAWLGLVTDDRYAEYEAERLVIYGEARGVDERDRWLAAHAELGRSLYDVHTDGSGVCHSSRLRPIVNLRPDYFTPTTRGFRHYAQDLLLLQVIAHQPDHRAEAPSRGNQRLEPGLVQRPGGDLPDDGGRHLRAQRLEQAVQPAVLLGHGQEGLDRGSRREGEHLELALDHGVHHP